MGRIANANPYPNLPDSVRCDCGHQLNQHWLTMEYNGETRQCPHCNCGVLDNPPHDPIAPKSFGKAPQNMSAINLCERCDSLMLQKAVAKISHYTTGENVWKEQELCPGCYGDFMRFLETKPDREKQTYREPWTKEKPQTESMLMLERGYCGEKHDNPEAMCLRVKGHDGMHRDGALEW